MQSKLFMKVRREGVQTRSEAGTQRRKARGILLPYVEGLNGETAHHSLVSALTAEVA